MHAHYHLPAPHPFSFNWTQIRCALPQASSLGELGTATKTARHGFPLFCSGAVSDNGHLCQFDQQEYDEKLYQGNGRGIGLTREERDFLRNSKAILSQAEKQEEKLNSNQRERKVGSLTVGESHGPSASLLPSLLARFQKNHPQTDLTLEQAAVKL
ncbi:MAG: hypothetical protein O7B35_15000 [Deltaproteobacteria bacterium]|nr:hypothetical protein [Deltaproteobacteria bacterium]